MATVAEFTNSTMLGTIQFVNVMHVRRVGGGEPTIPGLQVVAQDMASGFYNLLTSYTPSGAQWQAGTKVTTFDEATPELKTIQPITPVPTAGTGTGASLPGQLAVCIDWLTARAGRSYRGRTFYGPLNSAALGGPVLSPSASGSFNSAGHNLPIALQGISAEPYDLVVYSKLLHESTVITGGYTDGVVDTLRSRKY
jgi:hypothetical protein